MSETIAVQTLPEQQEAQQGRPEITATSQSLNNSMWGLDDNVVVGEGKETVSQPPAETKLPEVKEEIKVETPTATPWFKDMGYDNEDAVKNELTELKKIKEQAPQDLKFENDESKKVFELLREGKTKDVLKIYETQEKIDAVLNQEVTKETAADIIKLGMKLKYPSLTDTQIDFQYRQEFSAPKEPVQKADELDEDFTERHNEWKEKAVNAEMKATIAATMAKPEIEQAKTKIVLPDISNQATQTQAPTQEELEKAKRFDEVYVQSVESSMKEFKGFSVSVKNEAVGLPEISVGYEVTDNEKAALTQELKDFSQNGYNANPLFSQRWVNEDGTLNTKLIAEDRYWLANRDKIIQKTTFDAATKAIESYIKGKKNININETFSTGTTDLGQTDKKTELDTVRDQFFA